MARVVRDIAHKSGKEVHFLTEGEDTEIDRGMVEALADPLLHLVRHAVDHGLEAPEERAAAGKPAAGTVTLRAFQAAGVVVIELQDDGRGLDRDRILAKAVAQGLVDEGRDLPDSEVYRLIFAAGLSTAEKVTDISGRGVGMDVVARNLETLRGRVEITSARGEGTTFSIRLPLTLAIMEGMLARVGQERYIIPTISIQQAFQARAEEITTLGPGSEIVRFRDRLVPIVRLHRVFGVADAVEDCAEALLVIAEQGTSRFALMVDELLGQQQIVIKSLGRGLQQVPGLSGSAILGDGRVGLILDLAGLDTQAVDATAA
jgi:two-component system chemotaxis sensor kinase CheA